MNNNQDMNDIFIVGDVVQLEDSSLWVVENVRWMHSKRDWLHTLKALNCTGWKSYYMERMRNETVLYRQSDLTATQHSEAAAEMLQAAMNPDFSEASTIGKAFTETVLNSQSRSFNTPIEGFNPFEVIKKDAKIISISFVKDLHE